MVASTGLEQVLSGDDAGGCPLSLSALGVCGVSLYEHSILILRKSILPQGTLSSIGILYEACPFFSFIIMCMGILFACVSAPHVCSAK